MLDEYFSLKINGQGQLESLPLLMGDYTPNLDKLPLFLMRLGPQVGEALISSGKYVFDDSYDRWTGTPKRNALPSSFVN